MKKTVVALLIFVLLSLSFTTLASGLKVWPGKIDMTINRWYKSDENVETVTIQVQNPSSKGIDIAVRVENPGILGLTEGYTQFPDTSWIKITPEMIYLPPNSDTTVEVSVYVPENRQEEYFNQNWETYVVVGEAEGSGGGVSIITELAVKLHIHSPSGVASGLRPEHWILIISISLSIIIISYFYSERKSKKSAQYYFKKKK